MTGIFKLKVNHWRKDININKNSHCHNMPAGKHAVYILPSTQNKSPTKFIWKPMSDISYSAYFLKKQTSA